jgi:hypothetical protein
LHILSKNAPTRKVNPNPLILIRYLREFKGREVMVSPELAVRRGGAASLGYVTETQVIAPSSGEKFKDSLEKKNLYSLPEEEV